jgi:hypothetical protein
MEFNKVLLAIRHAQKGGSSEYSDMPFQPDRFIGLAGYHQIENIKLPDILLNTPIDLFGSGTLRTHQELLALALFFQLKGVPHYPLLNMGNDVLFSEWENAGLAAAAEKTGSNMAGCEMILGADGFHNACMECSHEIMDAFRVMQHHYGLGVFHSPTIEMAALAFSMTLKETLPENIGVIFVQDKNNRLIQCTGLWEPGQKLPEIQ